MGQPRSLAGISKRYAGLKLHPGRAHLQCLVSRVSLNKSSLPESLRMPAGARKRPFSHSARQGLCRSARSIRAGRKAVPSRWPALLEGERLMKQTMKALLVAGGGLASALGVGAETTPAQAQGKTITPRLAPRHPAD